jgi:hypothetical protein
MIPSLTVPVRRFALMTQFALSFPSGSSSTQSAISSSWSSAGSGLAAV